MRITGPISWPSCCCNVTVSSISINVIEREVSLLLMYCSSLTMKRAYADLFCQIFEDSGGRFLRSWAWLDTGGAADDAWRHPDMHREQAPEVADILIANRP